MRTVTAILSMLHESPTVNSARRCFRSEPVLWWTLKRLAASRRLSHVAVVCWDDQANAVDPLAADHGAYLLAKTPRQRLAGVEAIAAARRWSDGWRGGLLGACWFDRGFHAPWFAEAAQKLGSDAIVLLDPAASLVDPGLIDALIDHARTKEHVELAFMPTAPGLGGALVKHSLLNRLVGTGGHAGRQLHYWPGVHVRDPLAGDGCAPAPTIAARSLDSFLLDSQRRIARVHRATAAFNGQLIEQDAQTLVRRLASHESAGDLPRDVTLELTTQRASRPIHRPGTHLRVDRSPMSLDAIKSVLSELARADDLRLTLGGVGDPLTSPMAMEAIESAQREGIGAIHVETDLLGVSSALIGQLAASAIDVVSVFLPAVSEATYLRIMGCDGLGEAMENLKALLSARASGGRSTPLVVPTFVKCQDNLAEMEAWYDHWLKTLGCAAIVGPSDFGGLIPDMAVADMSPPRRTSCRRLASGLTILCDGTIVPCEEDVVGRQAIGRALSRPISEHWKAIQQLRADHACGRWDGHAACRSCRQWHRP
jgi:hypothetical protein